MMSDLKTRPTDGSVQAFLESIEDEERRRDCLALLQLMREVTGHEPKLWGGSIVGFGSYHYKYASGREGDTFLAGFSPRKQNLTLYLTGYLEHYESLLGRLGKHKTGKGCLYIKKLDDVDLPTLREMIKQSVARVAQPGEG
jgi:hypothetical protein